MRIPPHVANDFVRGALMPAAAVVFECKVDQEVGHLSPPMAAFA
jgi:hypothetical protein